MAYNFFPTGYQNYQPTFQSNNAQSSALIWVSGEAGAKAYLVAPNSTVVLWDTESDTVYIKSADASGMPSIKTLDYTVRGGSPKSAEILPDTAFATKEDISLIRDEIDAIKEQITPKKTKASER